MLVGDGEPGLGPAFALTLLEAQPDARQASPGGRSVDLVAARQRDQLTDRGPLAAAPQVRNAAEDDVQQVVGRVVSFFGFDQRRDEAAKARELKRSTGSLELAATRNR